MSRVLARMQATVLALLLQCCWAQLVLGQSVICESPGHCEETSSGCVKDDPYNCITNLIVNNDKKYASYEPSDRASDTITVSSPQSSCEDKTGWSSMERTNMTLESLKLDYISRSPKYVTICASWNLTQSSGQNGGFAVEVTRRGGRANYRYCVTNSTTRKVCINNFWYDKLRNKEQYIRVYPFKQDGDVVRASVSKTERIHNDLVGCADVSQSVGTCGPKHYSSAENLTVRSCLHGHEDEDGANTARDLRITWEPPTGAVELPGTYYVTLYTKNWPWRYFKVTDSLQVTVRNVSASFNYTVKVQPYGRCVGLGDYPTTNKLGCGDPTGRIMEVLTECTSPASTTSHNYTVTTPYKYTLGASRSDRKFDGPQLYSTVVFGIIGGILLVAIVLTPIVLLVIRTMQHSTSLVTIYPKFPQKLKVFVFYASSMSESRLKIVQERIVCTLLEYFDVVTPNDKSSGNISIWLEDVMKSVDSIFLVGNKEFCCDWMKSKEERSPVMNSLELLISSAAAQDAISRFGFISAEDSVQDVFIPDNSYLKVMPVFLLGQKTCDIDKLYQFVTKSRGIELTTDT